MRLVVFGATGGIGRAAVEQAVLQGHGVTAFARRSPTLEQSDPAVQVIVGDATNADDVARAIAGHDAVLCALGADTRGPTQLYSTAAANIVAGMDRHGVSRLLFLSNFGVLGERSLHPLTALLTWLVRMAVKHTLADHRAALAILRDSSRNWTAVRPMALTDGPLTRTYRVSERGLPSGGARVSRSDVAHFMLEQLERAEFIRQAPALAY